MKYTLVDSKPWRRVEAKGIDPKLVRRVIVSAKWAEAAKKAFPNAAVEVESSATQPAKRNKLTPAARKRPKKGGGQGLSVDTMSQEKPTLTEDLDWAAEEMDGLAEDYGGPTSSLATRLRAASQRLRDRLEFLRNLRDPRMAAWRLQVLGELEALNNERQAR